MFSVLPGVISITFLVYGILVVAAKGINRITTSFLILCVATFFWQFTWAVLFQAEDPEVAVYLIRIGWLLILFIPSAIYHFLVEVSRYRDEMKWVCLSYVVSAILSIVLLFTDLIVDGYYEYFWGFYPKAGDFHFIHVFHTIIVVSRALYTTYRKQKLVQADERAKLRFCNFAVLVYLFAAVDYACNYGIEVYPVGVIFVAVSLAIFAGATIKYHVMDGAMILAASIAHELRTPLATVGLQANLLTAMMPELVKGYKLAQQSKLLQTSLDETDIEMLSAIGSKIGDEARRSNKEIDMLLALMRMDDSGAGEENGDYRLFSAANCVENVVLNYPYKSSAQKVISVEVIHDFDILAAEWRLNHVLNNLIKNALYSINEKGSGHIKIVVNHNTIEVVDTGLGISPDLQPHIFDNWFTTKSKSRNAGVGLTFCKRTMKKFGGSIVCESEINVYTKFILNFKRALVERKANGA
jgi:two-component system CAI-1 autoinducer sensor kinase/phosphatase CqsS